MPDIALTFVRRLSNDAPDALRETRELLARMQQPRSAPSGGSALDRHAALCDAVDAEIEDKPRRWAAGDLSGEPDLERRGVK